MLQSTAPEGGDYSLPGATVIALIGVVFPPPALNMSALCQVSRGTPAHFEYVGLVTNPPFFSHSLSPTNNNTHSTPTHCRCCQTE
jgi:hypothetical protein